MTDILCQWMNDDVRLSQRTEKAVFAQQFASGFLFAELLAKCHVLVRKGSFLW